MIRTDVALATVLAPMALVAAAISVGCPSRSEPQATHGLPFIQNDYARARDQAKRQDVPLFVEVGAVW